MVEVSTVNFSTHGQAFATEQNYFLAALPEEDFALLSPHLVETTLWRGQVLKQSGQPVKSIFFPHSGLISLTCGLPDGRAIETASIGRDGAVGLTAGYWTYEGVRSAVVQVPGIASQIAAEPFAEAVEKSKALRTMILRGIEAMLVQVEQRLLCALTHPIQGRLCRWLMQARDHTGQTEFAVTQDNLAGMLGVQRTTLNLVCTTLQSHGVISTHRGRIRIHDAGALEKNACACYAALRTAVSQLEAGSRQHHLRLAE
jgi:CRP-like cAMP-binding protein